LWNSNLSLKRNLGGRPKIKLDQQKSIASFFNKNSTIAANRFLKLQNANARYRLFTLKDGYNKFLQRNDVKFASFYKYAPKYIKRPARLTDLCSYCQLNKVVKNFY